MRTKNHRLFGDPSLMLFHVVLFAAVRAAFGAAVGRWSAADRVTSLLPGQEQQRCEGYIDNEQVRDCGARSLWV